MAEILRLQSDDEDDIVTPGDEKASMVSLVQCFQSMVSVVMCDAFRRRF